MPVNTPAAPSPPLANPGLEGGKTPSLARPELMLDDKREASLHWDIAGSKCIFDEAFLKIILWSKEEKIYWPFSSSNKTSHDCSCSGCETGARNSLWLNPKRVWGAGVWPLGSLICTLKKPREPVNSSTLLLDVVFKSPQRFLFARNQTSYRSAEVAVFSLLPPWLGKELISIHYLLSL